MDRKLFLRTTIGAFLAGIPLLSLTSCGDDDDDDNDAPDETPTAMGDCGANGTSASIGTNHGHTLSVSKEDVVAGTEKSYDIEGSATHPHTVVVTAAMFTSLMNNEDVNANSSSDNGHAHGINIVCA